MSLLFEEDQKTSNLNVIYFIDLFKILIKINNKIQNKNNVVRNKLKQNCVRYYLIIFYWVRDAINFG